MKYEFSGGTTPIHAEVGVAYIVDITSGPSADVILPKYAEQDAKILIARNTGLNSQGVLNIHGQSNQVVTYLNATTGFTSPMPGIPLVIGDAGASPDIIDTAGRWYTLSYTPTQGCWLLT
jgi:hypothetical protein